MDLHWSHKVSETTLSFSATETCPIPISGGSENGHFCCIGDNVKHDKLKYHSGPATKLHPDDIILEVQGQKVAGYTSHDLQDWIVSVGRNLTPILIKTALAGTLSKELRPYLNSGFPKGSVDHDTQMTIRENLFQRTVPCTTRPARDGEVNGVDYIFVTLEQFKAMERAGHLLESGEFDGNFYGMPKPPKASSSSLKSDTLDKNNSDIKPGAHPSSKGKRQRNRSTIEATTNKNFPIDDTVTSGHIPGTTLVMPSPGRRGSRGHIDLHKHRTNSPSPSPGKASSRPKSAHFGEGDLPGNLPPNWEMAQTQDGHTYYIDQKQASVPPKSLVSAQSNQTVDHGRSAINFHNTEKTQWTNPRMHLDDVINNGDEDDEIKLSPDEELPYGWERVDDPHYGTYYIDHLNKKTQYDPPPKPTFEAALNSPSPSAKSAKSNPSVKEIDSGLAKDYGDYVLVSQQNTKPFFTKNPNDLSGQIFVTNLIKSPRGFGFTIVGGEERDEEFLQIKNVVPHGPAHQDGKLATGDVLVRVNEQLVLGFTHSDVVSMFQKIKPGETVKLEVCRGYPLAFDPNDPNTEIVTTVAVSMPKYTPAEAKKREVERAMHGVENDDADDDNESLKDFANSLLQDDGIPQSPKSPNSKSSATVLPPTGKLHSIEIVRGSNGFGFTIADSASGQKVKNILDPGRCKTLQEGDILVEIDGKDVRNMNHLDVVNVLKGCQQGRPTLIVVQRGGLKKSPRKPSQSRLNEETNDLQFDKSEPQISSSTPTTIDHAIGNLAVRGRSEADTPSPLSSGTHSPDEIPGMYSPSKRMPEGMFKWIVNSSTPTNSTSIAADSTAAGAGPASSRSVLSSYTSYNGMRSDDSDGHQTPPPLPSKGRLSSETSDSKENLVSSPTSQHPVTSNAEAPSSMLLPSHLRDSTNINRNSKILNEHGHHQQVPIQTLSHGVLPSQQTFSQHPVMNQYNQHHPPQRESFYDVPNKFRSDSALTAQQRFDMFTQKNEPKRDHEFGQPLDTSTRNHPRVLPPTQSQPTDRRSRTPGPEHMRAPPDRSTDDRFRSKTPNPNDHRHRVQNNLNHSSVNAGNSTIPPASSGAPPSTQLSPPKGWTQDWQHVDVNLRRGEQGFGFRIVGGPEEGTQVAIGFVVPGGAADSDGRLKTGDEIVRVDGKDTLGESHHKVVALMGQASSNGFVNLGVRRRILVQVEPEITKPSIPYNNNNTSPVQGQTPSTQTYDVIVSRRENEGFGFIIVSSVNRVGAVLGRIIEKSPAERCGKLRVGDRILSVNDVDISNMLHEDIVNLIKDSGYSVKLAIAPPLTMNQDQRPNLNDLDYYSSITSTLQSLHNVKSNYNDDFRRASMVSATALPALGESETLVRNMQSHTTSSTADRYNGVAPSNNQRPPFTNYTTAATVDGGRLPSDRYTSSVPQVRPSFEPPRPAVGGYDPVQRPPSSTAAPIPAGYDPSRVGVRMPITAAGPPSRPLPASSISPPHQTQQLTEQAAPGSVMSIELQRGSRGFGFSIRGGREFNNMPLYVLRIAEDGAAFTDKRLLVGDEILEINSQQTQGMSHSDAINLIQSGGTRVQLLIRRTGQIPNNLADQSMPSPQGSGMSSPAIRAGAGVSNTAGAPAALGVPASSLATVNKLSDRASTLYDNNPASFTSRPDRYQVPPVTSTRQDQVESNNLPAQPNYQPYQSDRNRIMGYQRDRFSPAPAAHRYDQSSQPRSYPDTANQPRGYPELTNQQRGYPEATNQSRGFTEPTNQQRGYPETANQQRGYPEPTNQIRGYQELGQQARGYPVGRETAGTGPYQQTPPYHTNNTYNNRPYQDSYKTHNSPQYGPAAAAPSAMSASYPGPNQINISNDGMRRSQTSAYPTGYNQPQHDGQGSYNAGAMNRQLNQQMNTYYNDNNRPSNGQERQPPIGQNNHDSRAPASTAPATYNNRYNGPRTSYKQLDYGPQGMINPNTGVQHYPRYGGSNDTRGFDNNQTQYNNMRQPTYQ